MRAMNGLLRLLVAGLGLALAACSGLLDVPTEPAPTQPPDPTPEATVEPTQRPTAPAPEHRIAIRTVDGRAEFYDRQTGERFIPRGVNYQVRVSSQAGLEDRVFAVGVFDRAQLQQDFALLRARGFNTVRMFIDHCSLGSACIGRQGGSGLNPAYLDNLAAAMEVANEEGLTLLLTSNDLPAQGGYWEISNRGAGPSFAGYRNAHYLTEPGVEAAQRYWDDLLRGLRERQAPLDAVFAWSLLNEQWFFADQPPLSLESGEIITANGVSYDLGDPEQKRRMLADGVRFYIEQVRAVIMTHDPTALVTMGFFHPSFPNPARLEDGWYVDTAQLLLDSALDFFDFHTYPGVELSLPEYAENFGMIGYEARPIIMGEVGAFTHAYRFPDSAASVIQAWIAESCAYGWDGWLYWEFYRPPDSVGDATWGFLDQEAVMMEALAPAAHPDPCVADLGPGANLAFGRPVRASRFLAEELPEYAVDGGPAQWGAGADAPQWIEVDLGAPAVVREIRLVVAQWPAGETVHQIWVRAAEGSLRQVHEFRQATQEGDVLTFRPETELADVRFVRVITVSSPSWVAWHELEVLGAFEE